MQEPSVAHTSYNNNFRLNKELSDFLIDYLSSIDIKTEQDQRPTYTINYLVANYLGKSLYILNNNFRLNDLYDMVNNIFDNDYTLYLNNYFLFLNVEMQDQIRIESFNTNDDNIQNLAKWIHFLDTPFSCIQLKLLYEQFVRPLDITNQEPRSININDNHYFTLHMNGNTNQDTIDDDILFLNYNMTILKYLQFASDKEFNDNLLRGYINGLYYQHNYSRTIRNTNKYESFLLEPDHGYIYKDGQYQVVKPISRIYAPAKRKRHSKQIYIKIKNESYETVYSTYRNFEDPIKCGNECQTKIMNLIFTRNDYKGNEHKVTNIIMQKLRKPKHINIEMVINNISSSFTNRQLLNHVAYIDRCIPPIFKIPKDANLTGKHYFSVASTNDIFQSFNGPVYDKIIYQLHFIPPMTLLISYLCRDSSPSKRSRLNPVSITVRIHDPILIMYYYYQFTASYLLNDRVPFEQVYSADKLFKGPFIITIQRSNNIRTNNNNKMNGIITYTDNGNIIRQQFIFSSETYTFQNFPFVIHIKHLFRLNYSSDIILRIIDLTSDIDILKQRIGSHLCMFRNGDYTSTDSRDYYEYIPSIYQADNAEPFDNDIKPEQLRQMLEIISTKDPSTIVSSDNIFGRYFSSVIYNASLFYSAIGKENESISGLLFYLITMIDDIILSRNYYMPFDVPVVVNGNNPYILPRVFYSDVKYTLTYNDLDRILTNFRVQMIPGPFSKVDNNYSDILYMRLVRLDVDRTKTISELIKHINSKQDENIMTNRTRKRQRIESHTASNDIMANIELIPGPHDQLNTISTDNNDELLEPYGRGIINQGQFINQSINFAHMIVPVENAEPYVNTINLASTMLSQIINSSEIKISKYSIMYNYNIFGHMAEEYIDPYNDDIGLFMTESETPISNYDIKNSIFGQSVDNEHIITLDMIIINNFDIDNVFTLSLNFSEHIDIEMIDDNNRTQNNLVGIIDMKNLENRYSTVLLDKINDYFRNIIVILLDDSTAYIYIETIITIQIQDRFYDITVMDQTITNRSIDIRFRVSPSNFM